MDPKNIPSILDEMSLEMAEKIVSTWASFDRSTWRAQYKASIQVAISRAVVDNLMLATQREFEGKN